MRGDRNQALCCGISVSNCGSAEQEIRTIWPTSPSETRESSIPKNLPALKVRTANLITFARDGQLGLPVDWGNRQVLLTKVTTTLSSRGEIVIPRLVLERCHLQAGDQFVIEDYPDMQVLTLRKVKGGGDWFGIYMECPHSLELPPRRRQIYPPKHELAR